MNVPAVRVAENPATPGFVRITLTLPQRILVEFEALKEFSRAPVYPDESIETGSPSSDDKRWKKPRHKGVFGIPSLDARMRRVAYLFKTEDGVTVEFLLRRTILWRAEIRARFLRLTLAEHLIGCLSYHAHLWRSHRGLDERDYLWEPGAEPRAFRHFDRVLAREFKEAMPAKDAGMTRTDHESAVAETLRSKFSYRPLDATAVVTCGAPSIAA